MNCYKADAVSRQNSTALKLFQYAIDHGVNVVIPQNSLRERNQGRCSA